MTRTSIPIDNLTVRAHHQWNGQWFLLTANAARCTGRT
jgi:hypothetical protein